MSLKTLTTPEVFYQSDVRIFERAAWSGRQMLMSNAGATSGVYCRDSWTMGVPNSVHDILFGQQGPERCRSRAERARSDQAFLGYVHTLNYLEEYTCSVAGKEYRGSSAIDPDWTNTWGAFVDLSPFWIKESWLWHFATTPLKCHNFCGSRSQIYGADNIIDYWAKYYGSLRRSGMNRNFGLLARSMLSKETVGRIPMANLSRYRPIRGSVWVTSTASTASLLLADAYADTNTYDEAIQHLTSGTPEWNLEEAH